MRSLAIVTAGLIAASVAGSAQATITATFGQFVQRDVSARLFRYLNEDSGSDRKASIYTTIDGTTMASIPVYYLSSVSGLPGDLMGFQAAHLTVDLVSNVGTTGSGSSRQQLFDTTVTGTISFTRDTAAAEGTGSRTNLLTVSFTNAELDASQGAGALGLKSLDSATISYTSDFLDFSTVLAQAFSLSFSGASPTFGATIGESGRTIRFAGSGTFAAGPGPYAPPVPEASSWAMMVTGFGAVGGAMRSRRRAVFRFG
jgi:hypothetical protein